MDDTADRVRIRAPKIYSRELAELVFVQPYCRIQNVVDAGLGHRQTASNYLKTLVDIDVLREVKVGREKLFIHPKLIGLLTSESHTYKSYSAKPHSARKLKSAELKRLGVKAGVARTRTRKGKTP